MKFLEYPFGQHKQFPRPSGSWRLCFTVLKGKLEAYSCKHADMDRKLSFSLEQEVIKLAECEVYSYSLDIEGDPFLQSGAVWSVNFFFYNKKLKRILSFRCCCVSK